MELTKLISELKREKEQIDQAIKVLEQMVAVGVKRRGRPPKWLIEAKASPGPVALKPKKKRGSSAATAGGE